MAKKLTELKGNELKAELARRALDLIIVHNPTNKPYVVIWNTVERHVIPPKDRDDGYGPGNQMVTRYIAEAYMTRMTNELLTLRADRLVQEENAKRLSEGKPEMTKYQGGEQPQFESRIDNVEDRKKIMHNLFVRVEREYAGGYEETAVEEQKTIINRGQDSDLFDTIMSSVADGGTVDGIEEG